MVFVITDLLLAMVLYYMDGLFWLTYIVLALPFVIVIIIIGVGLRFFPKLLSNNQEKISDFNWVFRLNYNFDPLLQAAGAPSTSELAPLQGSA